MSRRRTTTALLFLIAVPALLVSVAVAAVVSQGMVVIDVAEGGCCGTNIHLRVPAALGHAALSFVPQSQWRELCGPASERELWVPCLRQISTALEGLPEGTVLAQVDGSEDFVEIRTRGSSLQILVRSDEDNVRVVVPLSLVHSVLRRMAAA